MATLSESKGDKAMIASPVLSNRSTSNANVLLNTSSATPSCATECMELSQSGGSFESTFSSTTGNHTTQDTQHSTSSSVWCWMWNYLCLLMQSTTAIYLPFLWQSFVGGLMVLKSLFLGQFILHGNISVDEEELKIPAISEGLYLDPVVMSGLLCLTLLACVAFAIHPDGPTWMVLRKLREIAMSFLHSSSTCWAWLLNDDTGVISTVLALATFCSLFFFCYVLHRTLSPKQAPRPKSSAASSTSASVSGLPNESCGTTVATSSSSKKKKKKKSAAKKRNTLAATQQNGIQSSSTLPAFPGSQTDSASVNSSNSGNEQSTNLPCSVQTERSRANSGSTADTASTCTPFDDGSAPLTTTQPPTQQPKRTQRAKPKRGSNNNRERTTHNQSHNSNTQSDLVVHSRWDALKPDAPSSLSSASSCTNSRVSQHRKQPQNNSLNHKHHPNLKARSAQSDSATSSLQGVYRAPQSSVRKNVSSSSPSSSNPSTPARASPSTKKTDSAGLQSSVGRTKNRVTPLPPQTPRVHSANDSFFSQLNPKTPPFAPVAPLLRAPPGFASQAPAPPSIGASPSLTSSTVSSLDLGSESESHVPFYLPPAQDSSLLNNNNLSDATSTTAGLLLPITAASSGATLPPGNGSPLGFRRSSLGLPENPFEEQENEAQIEAELQELGGRMIGSILDS